MEAIIASIVSAGLVGLLNWLFSQPSKQRDKTHELELRLTKAEEKLHGVGNRVTRTEEAIEDIRENMLRRTDLDAAMDHLERIVRG